MPAHASDPATFDAQLKLYRASVYRDPDRNVQPILDAMRAALPPDDALRRTQYEASRCSSNALLEQLDAGMVYARRVLDAARAHGDRPTIVAALLCLASFRQMAEGARQSLPQIQEARRIAESIDAPDLLGDVYFFSGIVASLVGEQAASLLDYQRARDFYNAAGIDREIPALFDRIAVSYRRMGYHDRAERMFRQVAEKTQREGNIERWSMAMLQIAYLYNQTGQPERAIPILREAIAKTGTRAHAIWRNAVHLALAEALILSGQLDEGMRTLDAADAGFAAIKDVSSTGLQRYVRAMGYQAQRRYQEALEQLDLADAYFQHDGNLRYRSRSAAARSGIQQALGRTADATQSQIRHLQLELELLEQIRIDQGTVLDAIEQLQSKRLENVRLRSERDAKAIELEASNEVRRWQWTALLAALLAGLLLTLMAIRRLRRNAVLARLAMFDPVTGVASRLNVITAGQRALRRAQLAGHRLSLMMIDADYFKRVNDSLGHQVGDEVLKRIAQTCAASLRDTDTIGRYGGEEFMVVCPSTPLDGVERVAQRIREAVRGIHLSGDIPGLQPLSVSIGIAVLNPEHDTWEALVERADKALYRAKSAGRDCIMSADA